MAVNKVVDRLGNVIIDLSNDTIAPNKVLEGETFHDGNGELKYGTLQKPSTEEFDLDKYNFIDYDGELLYTFTDEEIDAMEGLPKGPDHADEGLVFQRWNWTLEDLKNVDRETPHRPIVGPNYISEDEKTYIRIRTGVNSSTIRFYFFTAKASNLAYCDIDWGDGTTTTGRYTTSTQGTYIDHTYPEKDTEYTMVITAPKNPEYLGIGFGMNSSYSLAYKIQNIRFGKIGAVGGLGPQYLEKIALPHNVKVDSYAFSTNRHLKGLVVPQIEDTSTYSPLQGAFNSCTSLKTVSIPKSAVRIGSTTFYGCYNLKNLVYKEPVLSTYTSGSSSNHSFSYCYSMRYNPISKLDESVTTFPSFAGWQSLNSINIPEGITTLTSSCFVSCDSLKEVTLPSTLKTINSEAFNNCKALKRIVIPDSVTSIGNSAFDGCNLILDLSQQTKVISLTSAIGLSTGDNYSTKILVPSTLLDSYKSASYWSSYANYMVGV